MSKQAAEMEQATEMEQAQRRIRELKEEVASAERRLEAFREREVTLVQKVRLLEARQQTTGSTKRVIDALTAAVAEIGERQSFRKTGEVAFSPTVIQALLSAADVGMQWLDQFQAKIDRVRANGAPFPDRFDLKMAFPSALFFHFALCLLIDLAAVVAMAEAGHLEAMKAALARLERGATAFLSAVSVEMVLYEEESE